MSIANWMALARVYLLERHLKVKRILESNNIQKKIDFILGDSSFDNYIKDELLEQIKYYPENLNDSSNIKYLNKIIKSNCKIDLN